MVDPRAMLEEIRRDFYTGQDGALGSEAAVEAFASTIGRFAADDIVCVMDGGALTTRYEGANGVRDGWRDFLSAFETIRIVPGEIAETADGLLEYVHLVGRLVGTDTDVEADAAAVWRIRGDKLAVVEFHMDRARARASAGLDS